MHHTEFEVDARLFAQKASDDVAVKIVIRAEPDLGQRRRE
jgi:hypothetical protein